MTALRPSPVKTPVITLRSGSTFDSHASLVGTKSLLDNEDVSDPPVFISVLGNFRLSSRGAVVPVRSGGKTEALLQTLALHKGAGVPRDTVIAEVWPDADASLAGNALSSLVYSLHNQLGPALDGAAPVINVRGGYRLNRDAGVEVDVTRFENLVAQADAFMAVDRDTAVRTYGEALTYYRGDLCACGSDSALVERERLRALHLTLLARCAAYYHSLGQVERCLDLSFRLLSADACREDAHRLVMRCHVARGERAQAMRQYRVCESILRSEFDAAPEPETRALYDIIRLDPGALSAERELLLA